MSSQFKLLRERRFVGLFWTQFFGALNDNVFKAALSLIFVYSGLIVAEFTDTFVNLAAGLFILPFFLFSATAGQIADKFEKSRLVRVIKLAEIGVAFAAGLAIYAQSVTAMLVVLFLLGVQSAFFGPLKFSILPQQLNENELVGGNAQIEMGTFVAILLGTIVGGIIASMEGVNLGLTAAVVVVAIIGYLASRFIPECPPTAPELKIGCNPFKETWAMVRQARENRSVYLSILGISWFWLLGSVLLTQIPNLTKTTLHGNSTVVTLILSVFTIAVAIGSLVCERMSGARIEIGIVPLGAFGMSVAGIDLYFAMNELAPHNTVAWLGFLGLDGVVRLLVDFGLVGFFGGMFIVPLYALIQMRTPAARRARIIAVNNIMNAVFMVSGAGLSILCLGLAGLSIPEFLLIAMLMNIAVSAFIFHQVPEFAMRFLIWLLSHTIYRVSYKGLEKIPAKGGAILVCNHVTFVDALILAGTVRRPIRFIMYKPIYDMPVLNFVFRVGGAIPIQGATENPSAFAAAFAEIRRALLAGDLLCIFPEGALTLDGDIGQFRRGIERIVAETPVPVLPMALQGLWGSFFSHSGGVFRRPNRLWRRVQVCVGETVAPERVEAAALQRAVRALRGEAL